MAPAGFLPAQKWNGKRYALGRLPQGAMNRSEQAYAAHLEAKKQQGAIEWYSFEGIKLRLADSSFYTADFAVMAADGVIELHEIKGFWEANAKTKIKVAAALFPFRFKAMKARSKKDGGGWVVENF